MTVPNPLDIARLGVSTDLTWRPRAEVSEYVDVSAIVEDLKKKPKEQK